MLQLKFVYGIHVHYKTKIVNYLLFMYSIEHYFILENVWEYIGTHNATKILIGQLKTKLEIDLNTLPVLIYSLSISFSRQIRNTFIFESYPLRVLCVNDFDKEENIFTG